MNILKKPYSQLERADFVCKNCYKKGLKIFETDEALYAIKQNETVIDGKIVEDADFEENQKKKRKEFVKRIFFESTAIEQILYKACGLDFEDAILFLERKTEENTNKTEKEQNDSEFDLKALKIELKQQKLKRDNEYLEKMLKIIGYNDEDIDELFLSGKLRAINARNG